MPNPRPSGPPNKQDPTRRKSLASWPSHLRILTLAPSHHSEQPIHHWPADPHLYGVNTPISTLGYPSREALHPVPPLGLRNVIEAHPPSGTGTPPALPLVAAGDDPIPGCPPARCADPPTIWRRRFATSRMNSIASESTGVRTASKFADSNADWRPSDNSALPQG